MEDQPFDMDALADELHELVPGFSGLHAVEKFNTGQSNPTYRVEADSGNYVLRAKPPGTLLKSAHQVDREYRVMKALSENNVPVPKVYGLSGEDSAIGRMYFVMELVEGRIFWDPALPEVSKQERAAIYDGMNDVLARLHSVDPEAAGLADYGRPGNYFARQIRRWSEQYIASKTEELPDMDRLMDWLWDNLPDDDGMVSVVHGDYRLDNMIFHSDENRVAAVLDWELSTLGDPIADFSYLMLNWHNPHDGRAGLLGLDLAELGIPTQDEAVERYVARTGYPVPPMDWYFAYNLFRLAGIMQGIKKRVIDGTASSAHAKSMSERVAPLVERAYHFAKEAGMD